jgi:L-cystine uptake protein TcyP (sodium:dicarboxylate symporter family)
MGQKVTQRNLEPTSALEKFLRSWLPDTAVNIIFSKGSSTTSAADSLAIPITNRYVAKTTGADAEALTLADGEPGQILSINLTVDGNGDGTLTPTTATGFVAVVLADAGDQIDLEFIDSTIGWIITGATGVAGPPAISLS